jgi:hypothetical protein
MHVMFAVDTTAAQTCANMVFDLNDRALKNAIDRRVGAREKVSNTKAIYEAIGYLTMHGVIRPV